VSCVPWYLQGCCGILVGADPKGELHDKIRNIILETKVELKDDAETLRMYSEEWRKLRDQSNYAAFITNDQRMIAALKLIGYETIEVRTVEGIESWA
jgi:hypothetical protein